MTDRELLELAAKAAGLTIVGSIPSMLHGDDWLETTDNGPDMFWNPLQNDGDALRLAVKLNLFQEPAFTLYGLIPASIEQYPYAATRRAIVRAAAEIGRNMK